MSIGWVIPLKKLPLKKRDYSSEYSSGFAGQQQLPQAIQDKVDETNASLYALNRDYFYQLNDDGQTGHLHPLAQRLNFQSVSCIGKYFGCRCSGTGEWY